MRTIVRVLAAAAAAGVVGGGAMSLAVPSTTPRDRVEATAVPDGRILRESGARPDPSREGVIHLQRIGGARILARAADPAGGPDWAVRGFRARRWARLDGARREFAVQDCVQLGRLSGNRFGWLDGGGTFRPVAASLFAAPVRCTLANRASRRRPELDAIHPLAGLGGDARITSTVVWGRTGAQARRVRLTVDGRELTGARGTGGAVLAVGPARLDASRLSASVAYGTGSPVAVGGRRQPGLEQDRSRGAEVAIAARAPDPNGGLPYALIAVRRAEGWCVGGHPGRVVDGRVGSVDFALGTFSEQSTSSVQCTPAGQLTRAQPFVESSGGDDLGEEPMLTEDQPQPQRVARRTLPGLTWIAGRARGDVRSLTLQTPRDVRTVVPSGPAHAYLVVYDGGFPSGERRTIAQFDDGSRVTTTRQLMAP